LRVWVLNLFFPQVNFQRGNFIAKIVQKMSNAKMLARRRLAVSECKSISITALELRISLLYTVNYRDFHEVDDMQSLS